MKIKFMVTPILLVIMLLACGKKPEALKITGWDYYKDPYFNISFKYPQGWPVIPEGGRFSVYSSQEVVNRFYDYSIKGKDGVRLLVSTQKMDTLKSLEQYVNELKTDLINSGFDITTIQANTLADQPGSLIHYGGAIDRDTRIEVIQVVAIKDTNLYTVKYEAFNELFTPYKIVLDTALTTLQLPKPKLPVKGEDPSIPAAEFEKFENNNLTILYPANFETALPQPKAPVLFSMDIKGYRQDSYIHIDIMPAKGLSAEKVVEQNAKFYKELSRGTTTIDGISTTYLNYSPMKDISSRVYFLVKNDRVYRIIFNYYAPMKTVYLPAFEKTVASLSAK